MGGCQNYGPRFGPPNTRCRLNTRDAVLILGTQRGTILLTSTHTKDPLSGSISLVLLKMALVSIRWELPEIRGPNIHRPPNSRALTKKGTHNKRIPQCIFLANTRTIYTPVTLPEENITTLTKPMYPQKYALFGGWLGMLVPPGAQETCASLNPGFPHGCIQCRGHLALHEDLVEANPCLGRMPLCLWTPQWTHGFDTFLGLSVAACSESPWCLGPMEKRSILFCM